MPDHGIYPIAGRAEGLSWACRLPPENAGSDRPLAYHPPGYDPGENSERGEKFYYQKRAWPDGEFVASYAD